MPSTRVFSIARAWWRYTAVQPVRGSPLLHRQYYARMLLSFSAAATAASPLTPFKLHHVQQSPSNEARCTQNLLLVPPSLVEARPPLSLYSHPGLLSLYRRQPGILVVRQKKGRREALRYVVRSRLHYLLRSCCGSSNRRRRHQTITACRVRVFVFEYFMYQKHYQATPPGRVQGQQEKISKPC